MITGIVQVAHKVKSLYDNAQQERERQTTLFKAQTAVAQDDAADDVVDAADLVEPTRATRAEPTRAQATRAEPTGAQATSEPVKPNAL